MDFPVKATLNYLLDGRGGVLLQRKSRGLGVGKWNGVGGKIEPGEGVEAAAKREIFEEACVRAVELKEIAYLEFVWPEGHEQKNWAVYVFQSDSWEGELSDGGEGELKWFRKEDFPFDEMWTDDQYWLLSALAGEFPRMRFYLNGEGETVRYEKIG